MKSTAPSISAERSEFTRLGAQGALTTLATLAVFGGLWLVSLIDPAMFEHMNRKDSHEGAGLVENLTVIVLIPGILAGFYALARYRRTLPSRWIAAWVLAWTLACIYFAGEECSWGQWYFGYATPEPIAALNDQGEANIHNISSWFDQKPRAIVEFFIIFAGLLVPVFFALAHSRPTPHDRWLVWTLAPATCWAAAACFLFMRIASLFDVPEIERMGGSEMRELGIAWFLALYLYSYPTRLSRLAHRHTQEPAS